MTGHMDHAFPAGDESEGSNDEWDVGYFSKKKSSDNQGSKAVVPLAKEDVSLLKRAISEGDVLAVEQLLDNGVEVETRLGFGWTPLMFAVHVANYNMAKLLLERGASANFSKDQYTALMAACTASAPEDDILRCVELLLSRHADPNMVDKCHMSCLMLAARDGYSKVINLLVSHGSEVNTQDSSGYTALSLAVQYGREEAVLKLLQLEADKTIRTKTGKSPADLALIFKQKQIATILASSSHVHTSQASSSKEQTLSNLSNTNSASPALMESLQVAKLGDIELLLHGLNLGYLADIMTENDITWSHLLTMEKDDLEKIGITEPVDQQNLLNVIQEMQLDRVDLETFNQLDNIDSGSEELYNFLISLRQQCCYLTETLQDIIGRFPQRASQLVLSLDPKQEAQAVCNQLVVQTGDLQREVICLRNLLYQMDQAEGSCRLPSPGCHSNWGRRLLTRVTLSALGVGLLFLLSTAANGKVHF